MKVAGRWRYVYPAIDQFGQVIDVLIAERRDARAAYRFFQQAIRTTKVMPVEVTTDQAPVYPAVLEELVPAAWHRTDRYANNRVEADHGRLKARLPPMRGLKHDALRGHQRRVPRTERYPRLILRKSRTCRPGCCCDLCIEQPAIVVCRGSPGCRPWALQ